MYSTRIYGASDALISYLETLNDMKAIPSTYPDMTRRVNKALGFLQEALEGDESQVEILAKAIEPVVVYAHDALRPLEAKLEAELDSLDAHIEHFNASGQYVREGGVRYLEALRAHSRYLLEKLSDYIEKKETENPPSTDFIDDGDRTDFSDDHNPI